MQYCPMATHPTHPKSVLVACSFELPTDSNIQRVRIFPVGPFRARPGDGRPYDAPAWMIDANIAAQVIARAVAAVDDILVDYEHQSEHTEWNGRPAPAAGWIKPAALSWQADGLWANVGWTDAAAAMIRAKEYRYLSPVFTYLPGTGEILELVSVALTNTPALDGLIDLAAVAALRQSRKLNKGDKPVNLQQLIATLGLPPETDEATAQAALTTLRTSHANAVAELAVLKAAPPTQPTPPATPDPARYVPVDAVQQLQAQLAALTAQISTSEADRLIAEGLADGRILPGAQEAWLRQLGATNIAHLRSHLATAPKIAALTGTQTNGQPPAGATPGGAAQLDAVSLAVCKQMGIKPEDFIKTRQEQEVNNGRSHV